MMSESSHLANLGKKFEMIFLVLDVWFSRKSDGTAHTDSSKLHVTKYLHSLSTSTTDLNSTH